MLRARSAAAILAVFLLAWNAAAETTVSGSIAENTTWTLANSPYRVTSTITVGSAATLTIEPGVVVAFDDGQYLQVNSGRLVARGTATDSIVFTAAGTATQTQNRWGGLRFSEGNALTDTLQYCRVSNASQAVSISNSQVVLENCVLRDFGYSGVYAAGANAAVTVTNCVFTQSFTNSGTRTGLNLQAGAQGTVSGNRFTQLRTGVFVANDADAVIQSNLITQNAFGLYACTEGIYGSLGTPNVSPTLDISGNTISGNSVYGVTLAAAWGNGAFEGNTDPPFSSSQTTMGAYDISLPWPSLHGNDLSANGLYSVVVGPTARSGATMSSMIPASGNYWGTTDGTQVARLIYDNAENESAPFVDFAPFQSAPVNGEPIEGYLYGLVQTDRVLTQANSPYQVVGNVYVRPTAKLTVEPGVRLLFQPGLFVQVDGQLVAAGTSTDSIVFTSARALPQAGDWGELRFRDTSDGAGCVLDYCRLEYFRGIYLTGNSTPAPLSLTHSVIRQVSGTGISVVNSSPSIEANLIQDFAQSGVFATGSTSVVTLRGNTIQQGSILAGQRTGINLQNRAQVTVSGNTVTQTRTALFLANGTQVTVTGNDLSRNAYGLYSFTEIYHGALGDANVAPSFTVSDNTISGNSVYGLAIGANYHSSSFDGSTDPPAIGNITSMGTGYDAALPMPAVHGNRIASNGTYNMVVGPTTRSGFVMTGMLPASGNYWGTVDGVAIARSIYDNADNENAPFVDFAPFLSAPTGGQLVEGYLYGLIGSDRTLTKAQSPYRVVGNVYVRPTVNLTIEPGVRLEFQPGLNIQVDGQLTAVGTVADSIRFTSASTMPQAGDWGGLRFREASDNVACQLDYCVIEYFSSNTITDSRSPEPLQLRRSRLQYASGMALSMSNSAPTISQTEIRDFGTSGIYATGSLTNLQVTGCTIEQGVAYAGQRTGVNLQNGAQVTLTNNRVARARTGVFISNDVDATLTGNTVTLNAYGVYAFTEANHGTLGTANVAPTVTLSDNTIDGNTTYGLALVGYYTQSGFDGSGDPPAISSAAALGTGYDVALPVARLHHNSLAANGTYNMLVGPTTRSGVVMASMIEASENYWGTSDAVAVANMIYDNADNEYAPFVDFAPFRSQASGGDLVSGCLYGLVQSSRTLTKAASPYKVVGNVYVRPTVQVTIEPGVRLEFQPGLWLQIDGQLTAVGTDADSIVFASARAMPAAGDWGGIRLRETSDNAQCVLDHCVLQHFSGVTITDSRSPLPPRLANSRLQACSGTAVLVQNSAPTITRTVIRDFGANGIFVSGSGSLATIDGNTIEQSAVLAGQHTGINLQAGAQASVTGNTITQARTGIFAANGVQATVTDNTIGRNVYGIYAYTDTYYGYLGTPNVAPQLTITGNAIDGNSSYGLAIGGYTYSSGFDGTGDPPAIGSLAAMGTGTDAVLAMPTVHNNSLAANGTYNLIVGPTTRSGFVMTAMIPAAENYWGTADGIAVARMIYDNADNEYAPFVDFAPYLSARSGGSLVAGVLYGLVQSDRTLTAADSPYQVVGNVYIRPTVSVAIEPGVTLKFQPGLYVQVDGQLVADGTATEPITFTSAKATPAAGDWGGLRFRDTSDNAPCLLDHCNLEYLGGISVVDNRLPSPLGISYSSVSQATACGIYVQNSTPTIDHTVIKDFGQSGVFLTGAATNALLTNNTLTQSLTLAGQRTGINIQASAGARLSNNRVTLARIGVFAANGADVTLTGNTLSQNAFGLCAFVEGYYGAYGPANVPPVVTASENVISGNTVFGVVSYTYPTPTGFDGTGDPPYLTSVAGGGWYDNYRMASLVLQHNNLASNGSYNLVLGGTSNPTSYSQPVVATNNFWGYTDAAPIAQLIYDRVDFNYAPEVTFEPFLSSLDEITSIAVRGDLNGDGHVNILDVRLVINQALGLSSRTDKGDLNLDGSVNIIDVRLAINIVLGIVAKPVALDAEAPLQLEFGTPDPAGRVPLMVTGGDRAVTDLQLDLAGGVVLNASAGEGLAQAGKSVHLHTDAAGQTTILITGLSQEPIPSGAVLWLELGGGGVAELATPRALAVDRNGQAVPVQWGSAATAVDLAAAVPAATRLAPNYPNPFNPQTTIRYEVGSEQVGMQLSVAIYDLAGQRIRQLTQTTAAPGTYHITWDGRDDAGRAVASGVYLCRLQAGSVELTRKLTLSR